MEKKDIIAQKKNRINILENRGKDNSNIIRKLNREIKNLSKK